MTATTGHCACGAVTIRIAGFEPKLWVCHCEPCRRWQGFAGMGLDVPAEGFHAEGPVRIWRSSAVGERAFCGECASPLWFRALDDGGTVFEPMAGLFADAADAALDRESFTDRRPEGLRFAGTHRRKASGESVAVEPLTPPSGSSDCGGCACGAVRFRLDAAAADCGACHCATCRAWTGGVFVAVDARDADLHLEKGADRLLRWSSSEGVERVSCAECGGKLWYHVVGPEGDFTGGEAGDVEICLGAIDDMAGRPLRREMFIDDKPAGYAFAAATTRLTGAEARRG